MTISFNYSIKVDKMEDRLQKFLSENGIASRREAEDLIVKGRVKVNGKVVTTLGTKVSDQDNVEVDDKEVLIQENRVYYLLNKPEGYISSTQDEAGRKTIKDLMVGVKERIYPVGRLDYDTSGLIIFTNDGDFSNMLLKPKNEIEKEYQVHIKGLLRKEESLKLVKGIDLGDFVTSPCRIFNVKYDDNKLGTTLSIVITEGKNREIRRMFDAVNHEVTSLKRIRFGNLILDIEKGTFRRLRPYEVKSLKLLALNGKPKEETKRTRTISIRVKRAEEAKEKSPSLGSVDTK